MMPLQRCAELRQWRMFYCYIEATTAPEDSEKSVPPPYDYQRAEGDFFGEGCTNDEHQSPSPETAEAEVGADPETDR